MLSCFHGYMLLRLIGRGRTEPVLYLAHAALARGSAYRRAATRSRRPAPVRSAGARWPAAGRRRRVRSRRVVSRANGSPGPSNAFAVEHQALI
jgi:hypothetical protein